MTVPGLGLYEVKPSQATSEIICSSNALVFFFKKFPISQRNLQLYSAFPWVGFSLLPVFPTTLLPALLQVTGRTPLNQGQQQAAAVPGCRGHAGSWKHVLCVYKTMRSIPQFIAI